MDNGAQLARAARAARSAREARARAPGVRAALAYYGRANLPGTGGGVPQAPPLAWGFSGPAGLFRRLSQGCTWAVGGARGTKKTQRIRKRRHSQACWPKKSEKSGPFFRRSRKNGPDFSDFFGQQAWEWRRFRMLRAFFRAASARLIGPDYAKKRKPENTSEEPCNTAFQPCPHFWARPHNELRAAVLSEKIFQLFEPTFSFFSKKKKTRARFFFF